MQLSWLGSTVPKEQMPRQFCWRSQLRLKPEGPNFQNSPGTPRARFVIITGAVGCCTPANLVLIYDLTLTKLLQSCSVAPTSLSISLKVSLVPGTSRRCLWFGEHAVPNLPKKPHYKHALQCAEPKFKGLSSKSAPKLLWGWFYTGRLCAKPNIAPFPTATTNTNQCPLQKMLPLVQLGFIVPFSAWILHFFNYTEIISLLQSNQVCYHTQTRHNSPKWVMVLLKTDLNCSGALLRRKSLFHCKASILKTFKMFNT